ncbi:MAG TPA: glutathione S-transferase [Candidatus Binataceae bacterium]|jgi:glutathione S-transferase|nr:glutathione S-transferase [Candidatus Binataceae bacterium]
MITIYHLATSRSERVIWLMEELGLQYNLERFAREPNMLAPASLRAIHPLGKSPIIRDGDTVLVESGAILEYIIQRHGRGKFSVPASSPDYPRYLQWMHFAEGSAMTQLLLHLFLGGLITGVDQSMPMVAVMKERTASMLRYIDDELDTRLYFAGDSFTAADIMMVYPYQMVTGFLQMDMSVYPNTRNYLERIGLRPAYRKAMEIANPPAKSA